MNGFIRLMIVGAMLASLTSCVGSPTQNDDLSESGDSVESADAPLDASDDSLADPSESSAPTSTAAADSSASDFEDFDTPEQAKPAPGAADSDLAIEDELNSSDDKPTTTAEAPAVPPVEDNLGETEPPPEQTTEITPPAVNEELLAQETVPPEVAPPETEVATPVAETPVKPIEITGLKFQANDAGGTVIVEANGPVTYTTRENPDLKQFIVEVENAKLPTKLKRNLNTKDIKGAIGTVDAYQNAGSTTARFVIQLRDGVGTPTVQSEGNSLLIVSAPGAENTTAVASNTQGSEESISNDPNVDLNSERILSSQNLADFLAGNTKFYGKKISIETNDMDVREALKFITEESGVNMVIADEVKGSLSLKLRQVPWDQALVMVMKARKLGYTRQGNVLRIASIVDLKQEEDDATKLAVARKGLDPLKVRMFPISYAKVDELEKKVKDFLTERGKVIGDSRTNAIIITDQEDSLERVAKLISSLDVQPAQVLIEGKIVEAKESFTRNVGVNWGGSGDTIRLGSGKRGPVNMRPSFSVNPAAQTGAGNFNFSVNVGTLDILGNLNASLALSEAEENVKVISSPRIMTLTNEKANISQTTEVPISVVTVTNGTPQTTFQFKPLKMSLEVTPQVTADASVIMNVSVNREFQGADLEGGGFPINARSAQTKVLVKNGQTAVIGGIYQSDATDGRAGTPWLKDIPILGSLFRTTRTRKEKIELVIFLTPRIIGQQQVDSQDTPTATKDF